MDSICPLLEFIPDGVEVPDHLREEGWSNPTKRPAVYGGKSGALITPCAGVYDLTIDPQHQVSVELRDGRTLLLDRRGKLTPGLVRRRDARNGHPVVLADGQTWIISPARLVVGGSALPRRRCFDDQGNLAWRVEERYQWLSEFAERLWAQASGHDVSISDSEIDRACGEALAVNYRIGLEEAVLAGLLDDAAQRRICLALIDYPTVQAIMDAEKKN